MLCEHLQKVSRGTNWLQAKFVKKMSPDNECTVVLFRKGLFLKWDSEDTRRNQETPNEDVDEVSQCSYIMETQKDITQVNERFAPKYTMLHTLRMTRRISHPKKEKYKSLKYHNSWLITCVWLFDRVWPCLTVNIWSRVSWVPGGFHSLSC